MRPFLIVAAALAVSTPAFADQTYVCASKPAHAFAFNHYAQRWGNVPVTRGREFTLVETDSGGPEKSFALYDIGATTPEILFDNPSNGAFANTPNASHAIRFNPRTLRAQIYYWPGYLASEEYDLPYVEFARCAPYGATAQEPVLVRSY